MPTDARARRYRPWGRLTPPARRTTTIRPDDPTLPEGSVLAFGNGRSYGDVCLNAEGTLLDTRSLDRIEHFDAETGRIRCQAGVLLSEILDHVVPHGWFLPVTPGTKFVTVAGAVANDVHGKNHHVAGTFGRHVTRLELLRSDGTRIVCGPDENTEWFRATVGGLGLTGLILWVETQLIPVAGRAITETTTPGTLSVSRTGDFSFTITGTNSGMGSVSFSLFHVDENHDDFGPFAVPITIAGGGGGA